MEKKEFERALDYMDDLYRYGLRLTRGDESEADDLVQDAYLRAYKHFDKFRRDVNLRAWLYSILRNTFINK